MSRPPSAHGRFVSGLLESTLSTHPHYVLRIPDKPNTSSGCARRLDTSVESCSKAPERSHWLRATSPGFRPFECYTKVIHEALVSGQTAILAEPARTKMMLFSCGFIVSNQILSARSMGRHQWQAAYPTLISIGRDSLRASSNAASVHGHQSTGLSLCCNRYGLVEPAKPLHHRRPRRYSA